MANRYGYTSRYSLADYIMTVRVPAIGNLAAEEISIGGPGENGEGSCVGEIKVTRRTDMWTTEGDPTGSWVHNKNLDKTGTIELNIKQVSANVQKLMMICSAYESLNTKAAGLTITINPANDDGATTDYITGVDVFIQKIPDQDYSDTAKDQQWIFTCGQVKYAPVI